MYDDNDEFEMPPLNSKPNTKQTQQARPSAPSKAPAPAQDEEEFPEIDTRIRSTMVRMT